MALRSIDARALHPAALRPPLSKSDAQRALVLARDPALCARILAEPELPADVAVTARGLLALAAGGAPAIDCADGGTPFRVLLGQAAVTPGVTTTFTGTPRLAERPHGPLFSALQETLGPAGFALGGHPWPLVVRGADGRAPEPVFRVDPTESSQFPSSLLLAAATLCAREGRPWTVALTAPPASEGYLALTTAWLRRSGYGVETAGSATTVSGTGATPPSEVPGDWSSAAYLLLLAWRAGGTVLSADPAVPHPDRAILDVLRAAGLTVAQTPAGLRVAGEPTGGTEASGAVCPTSCRPSRRSRACSRARPRCATPQSCGTRSPTAAPPRSPWCGPRGQPSPATTTRW